MEYTIQVKKTPKAVGL